MVVLTIVTQTNGETILFDEPLLKVHFMRLVSCGLYNSWHNLTSVGQMSFKMSDQVIASIPEGHYTVESIAKEMTKSFKINKSDSIISIENYNPNSVQKIILSFKTNKSTNIEVSHALAQLIGISTTLGQDVYIKKLNCPSTYFLHCNLIDKNQNFINNKKSDLLATFDVKGKPYEKVTYDASPQQPLRGCSTDSHVNNITVSVRNQNGELFDFKGLPLKFQLEIN